MKIFFGTDHAGFELKEALVQFVRDELGYQVEDLGAYEYNQEDDYPDFVAPVAEKVSTDPDNHLGVILGGSGQGEAICANRFPGVRAVVFYDPAREDAREGKRMAVLVREHNDANTLSLGARFLSEEEAKEAVRAWLATPFSGEERHRRRLEKISRLEF